MSRLLSLVVVALAALTTIMCVRDNLEPCGSYSCPVGDVCTEGGCASLEAVVACTDKPSGSPCTTVVITNGTCTTGACSPAACGNLIVDSSEICDDGNLVAGDGCSADCMSREKCGNDRVDSAVGEQCDSGPPGLSGDGCTSRCGAEFDFWREVTPPPPSPRAYVGLAPDPDPKSATGVRGILAVGGAGGSGSFLDGGSAAFDETLQWDGTSWVEPTLATPQIRRANFAMAFDELRRRVVLFGGVDEAGNALGDTWEWDGVTWIDRTPSSSPPPRSGSRMACDRVRGVCVLFGGRIAGVTTDETWEWNGTSWSFRPKVPPHPPARELQAMAFDGTKVVMFGGAFFAGAGWGDTWTYDGTWIQDSTTEPQPSGAHRPVAAHHPIIGATYFVINNNTWRYDGTWSSVAPGIAFPAGDALGDQQLAYDATRNRIVAFSSRSSGSVWELDASEPTPVWRVVQPRGPTGGAGKHTGAYDAARGRIVLFGSSGTWEWTGIAWVLRSGPMATMTPLPSDYAAMAYDSARRESIVFGGRRPEAHDEMWRYDGSTWLQLTPANRPLARFGHAMTFDAARNVTVVYGGTGPGDLKYADTHEWDGTSWVAKGSTPPFPKLEDYPAMAYDAARKVSVLFGTSDLGRVETWEWNGTTWTQRLPIKSPPLRARHGLAYDPLRGRVVVFGGLGPDIGGDAWQWDSAANTWQELVPLASPPPRSAFVFSPDVTGGLIAFGGANHVNPLNETWRLRLASGLSSPDRCVSALDDDGDGLGGCADPDCWRRCQLFCAPGTSCDPSSQRCGDGACSSTEDHVICAADCTAP